MAEPLVPGSPSSETTASGHVPERTASIAASALSKNRTSVLRATSASMITSTICLMTVAIDKSSST
ncbi:hypothetical protein A2348_02685 [Candidatus Uhrbacteria bacterium RIFOXYB12_FULL_58_10]|nr:MAG: hypothetical protein A2348_02685 [Candidatus Uhrbacteria bacterium RIFOXYB12_FULL_58_10]